MRVKAMAVVIALMGVGTLAAAAQDAARPTQTVQNLGAAIEGEANAAHRYTLFAARADEEGHPQVAELFRAAAQSERIHQRNHEAVLRALGAPVPQPRLAAIEVRSTRQNLLVPIQGERDEATETYPRYVEQARREGVPAAATSFTYAQRAEEGHQRLFEQALASLGQTVPEVDYWVQSESGVLEVRPGQVEAVTAIPTRASATG
jgi:rubrerythrin